MRASTIKQSLIFVLASASLFFVSKSSAASSSSSSPGPVTCGSAIKIKHVSTGYHLNSEGKSLNTGSGQQIVTLVNNPGTHDTLWWVRPSHHDVNGAEYPPDNDPQGRRSPTCDKLAEPIKCGSFIRLTHVGTMKNLHSHGVQSPLSRQQEISAFGEGDSRGDGGDDWKVICKGEYWERQQIVQFLHVDTRKYLGASSTIEFNAQTCGMNCPIMGHLEAFGHKSDGEPNKMTGFTVDQGVHIHV